MNDKWIGIEAAADYLDVSQDTIRNWIKKYGDMAQVQDLEIMNRGEVFFIVMVF